MGRQQGYLRDRAPKAHPSSLSGSTSYAERHDRVHDIIVVLPEGLDGLLPGHVGLSHDQVNVLGLEATLVNLLAILFLIVLLGLGGLCAEFGLVLVVVAGVLTASASLSGGQLLGSRSLGLGVQVLDLGLTEDAANSQYCFLFSVICKQETYIQVLLEGER